MSFSLYIAKRYLFSKSRNNTINIITLMATLGVIVGTLALFVVLSGFSGLREFSLRLLNTSDPDISIAAVQGKSFIFNQGLQDIIAEQTDIASYTKVIEERVLLEFNSQSQVAFIKGVDDQYTQVNRMDTTVYDGDWLSKEIPAGAVVGNGISNSLSIGAYDVMAPLSIFVPKPGKGYTNRPEKAFNQVKVQPIGVFSITEETDQKYVFISLEVAQELLSYAPDQVSGIELKLHNSEARSALAPRLQNRLGKSFKVQTREQLNAVFYKMLHTENLVSYLIFTLIVVIALFNVIGAIIMMILDKKDNLKTLYRLGATLTEIKRIFLLQGFLLTAFGMAVGCIIGIALVWFQQQFKWFMITPHIAYPVKLSLFNIGVVMLTILVLGLLASKIASSRLSEKMIA